MENLTLFGIITRGGILMIPLFLCSIIVIGVAIERYLVYRQLKTDVPKFLMNIRHPLSRGDILGAINECNMLKSPVANTVKAGLEKFKYGRERIKEAMESAGNTETYHLEKNLSILATLAGVAPLLGFLGTVTGMIKAFMKIQQLSGNVNADVLAGGIWEAMITTAAGLAIGIPAMIIYNHYINRVRGFIYEMETVAEDILDLTTNIEETGDKPERPVDPPPVKDREYPKKKNRMPENGDNFLLANNSFDPDDLDSGEGKII